MKKDVKKPLKIAGSVLLVLGIFQLVVFILRIYSIWLGTSNLNLTWFNYLRFIVEIALSLVTGIIYLVIQTKNREFVLKQQKLFFVLSLVNVFNSLVGWVLTFWVNIAIEQARRLEFSFVNPFATQNPQSQMQAFDENGNIIIPENNYEVLHTETLTTRLNEIDKLRSKNLISPGEYAKLRQEAIDNFLN